MEQPDPRAPGRFEVVVEEGVPHGDLYELEQTTYYQVVDRQSNRAVVTFEGRMETSLSRETGLWEGQRFSGVRAVRVAPDEKSALVEYHDGREEWISLAE